MQAKFFTAALLLFSKLALCGSGDSPAIPSELKSVTIYRSGAELTHHASTQLVPGNRELVIDAVSNTIDLNSLQVSCPAGVTLLGVEFATNYLVVPEVNARIQAMNDSLEKLQHDIDKLAIQIITNTDLLDVLKSNKDIKGQQTGLSVAELVKLMDYYKGKSAELQNELSLQKEKQKKLNDRVVAIRTQISEEQSRNTHSVGQLHLQLNVAIAGKYDFTISYITPNAFWTPFYDIRVEDIRNPLKLIYKAKLTQTTGIDWKKVKLSLSTSVPGQWGTAPVLKTWFLSYINPVHVMDRTLAASNTITGYGQSNGQPGSSALNEVVVTGMKARGISTVNNGATPLYVVNGTIMDAAEFSKIDAGMIKTMETLKGDAASALYGARAAGGALLVTLKDGLEDFVSVADNELNVTFDIDLPYDVPTNGKEQTATLREYPVGAGYQYYAVPRLDRDAYLLAEVPDWEKLNLLPGEANIIFEGMYVGKSFIDPNSTLDTLNLTLGRDKRIVVKKEKLVDYSSVKFLGSNKLQLLTYEITVKNNKKDSIRMLLKDQFPLSMLKEIEVERIEASGATVNPVTGVLSWQLGLAAGETRKLRFAYSVKYPREKQLNVN